MCRGVARRGRSRLARSVATDTSGAVDGSRRERVIRVEKLSKVFGRRAERALAMRRSGRSKAEVERETGSVIGLSESGKSTLPGLVNRLSEPTEGDVYLDGDLISTFVEKPASGGGHGGWSLT